MGVITDVESASCYLGGTTHILHAFRHCREDIAFCLRNCLLEVIQHAVIVFVGPFLRATPQKKEMAELHSGERGDQIFLEMRRPPKGSLSIFVVSLSIWQVVPSCCKQQSRISICNKAANCSTRFL
jgi:hypothetical protein